MASSAQIGDQDQKIQNFVEQAIQKVREEFSAHLTDLRRQLGLEEEQPPPVAAATSRELFGAIAAIDRARSQAEILSTLLERSRRFAGRSALFLTREDGLHGWAGSGFNGSSEKVSDLVMGYGEGTPWSRVATGQGSVSLTAAECAGMCARIDGSHPAEGILIPMVLRDQLAAAIYADRLEDESSIDLQALQLLTYVAAQAIETLPLRERPTTVTLRVFDEAEPSEPGLRLWSSEAAQVAAPTTVEAEEAVPEPAPPEVPTTEVTPSETEDVLPAEAPPVEAISEPWEEDEVVEEEISPMARVEAEPDLEDLGIEVEELPSPVDTDEIQTFGARAFELESTEEVEIEVEPEPPAMPEELAPTDHEPTQTFPTAEYATPEVAPPPAAQEPTEPIVPTVEAAPETDSAAPVSPPPERSVSRSASEIAPPEDLEGPGWAFTTSQIPVEDGDDALHEEAQRLARLLVTEIKLYNEDEVEEGRRNRNIYQTLREDINRSRQIYEERIDEKIRAETDYFHEELVRILAGGDADALGM